jgi:hypothetical protein
MLPHLHFEFAVTVSIVAGSFGLLAYWFRYTCLLFLSAKTARDYAADVAVANQLGFLNVQARLRQGPVAELDPLHKSLERDYSLITFLLNNAAPASLESEVQETLVELRMLQMYYRVMGSWYRVSRTFSTDAARHALEQMSVVVEHFANVMGERAACASAA